MKQVSGDPDVLINGAPYQLETWIEFIKCREISIGRWGKVALARHDTWDLLENEIELRLPPKRKTKFFDHEELAECLVCRGNGFLPWNNGLCPGCRGSGLEKMTLLQAFMEVFNGVASRKKCVAATS